MRLPLLIATGLVALAGLTACGGAESDGTTSPGHPDETSTAEAATAEPDPRLEALVGTWEADPDEVGPHGSTLTIHEDGTASLLSFANQHGAYEGAIVLGDAEAHRFEGAMADTGDEIVVELAFDADAETLTLTYPDEGGSYAHTRA